MSTKNENLTEARDENVRAIRAGLRELMRHPSLHPAAFIAAAAADADEMIEALLSDLKGWETQR